MVGADPCKVVIRAVKGSVPDAQAVGEEPRIPLVCGVLHEKTFPVHRERNEAGDLSRTGDEGGCRLEDVVCLCI